jgi:hypothetical protein
MYKTDFVCTYKAFEELEDDEVNSDMLYQAQFLQVFGLTEYDNAVINSSLGLIKAKANEVPELKALIIRHPYNTASDSEFNIDMILPLMFSYPLLDVFHLCLIDVFKTGTISAKCQDSVLRAYETIMQ